MKKKMKVRHHVHIIKAASSEIDFEIEQCKKAYYTLLKEFLPEVRNFLESSTTPEITEEEDEIIKEFEADITSLQKSNISTDSDDTSSTNKKNKSDF